MPEKSPRVLASRHLLAEVARDDAALSVVDCVRHLGDIQFLGGDLEIGRDVGEHAENAGAEVQRRQENEVAPALGQSADLRCLLIIVVGAPMPDLLLLVTKPLAMVGEMYMCVCVCVGGVSIQSGQWCFKEGP